MFQIMYIIVGYLCSTSLTRFLFFKAPPSNKHSMLYMANWHSALWLAEHRKHSSEMSFSFNFTLSIIASFSFQSKYKDS